MVACVGIVAGPIPPRVAQGLAVAGLEVAWRATTASLGSTARSPVDLVVLHVQAREEPVPELHGLAEARTTPVLAVIDGAERRKGVELLQQGADDFVTEGATAEEVAARAWAILRRTGGRAAGGPEQLLGLGALRVDESLGTVTLDGRTTELRRRELELLTFLLRRRDRAWSRAELLERVWGYRHGDLNTVTVHVCHLRRKLGDDPRHPRYIVTVPGRGYRAAGGASS